MIFRHNAAIFEKRYNGQRKDMERAMELNTERKYSGDPQPDSSWISERNWPLIGRKIHLKIFKEGGYLLVITNLKKLAYELAVGNKYKGFVPMKKNSWKVVAQRVPLKNLKEKILTSVSLKSSIGQCLPDSQILQAVKHSPEEI